MADDLRIQVGVDPKLDAAEQEAFKNKIEEAVSQKAIPIQIELNPSLEGVDEKLSKKLTITINRALNRSLANIQKARTNLKNAAKEFETVTESIINPKVSVDTNNTVTNTVKKQTEQIKELTKQQIDQLKYYREKLENGNFKGREATLDKVLEKSTFKSYKNYDGIEIAINTDNAINSLAELRVEIEKTQPTINQLIEYMKSGDYDGFSQLYSSAKDNFNGIYGIIDNALIKSQKVIAEDMDLGESYVHPFTTWFDDIFSKYQNLLDSFGDIQSKEDFEDVSYFQDMAQGAKASTAELNKYIEAKQKIANFEKQFEKENIVIQTAVETPQIENGTSEQTIVSDKNKIVDQIISSTSGLVQAAKTLNQGLTDIISEEAKIAKSVNDTFKDMKENIETVKGFATEVNNAFDLKADTIKKKTTTKTKTETKPATFPGSVNISTKATDDAQKVSLIGQVETIIVNPDALKQIKTSAPVSLVGQIDEIKIKDKINVPVVNVTGEIAESTASSKSSKSKTQKSTAKSQASQISNEIQKAYEEASKNKDILDNVYDKALAESLKAQEEEDEKAIEEYYQGIAETEAANAKWYQEQKKKIEQEKQAAINSELKAQQEAAKAVESYQSIYNRINKAQSTANTALNQTIRAYGATDANGNIPNAVAQMRQYIQVYKDLWSEIQNAGTTGDVDDIASKIASANGIQNVQSLDGLLNNLSGSVSELRSQAANQISLNVDAKRIQDTTININNLKREIQSFMNLNSSKMKGTSFMSDLQKLSTALNNGLDYSSAKVEFTRIKAGATEAGYSVETLYDRFTKLFGDHWKSTLIMGALNGLSQAARQVVENVVELDTSFTQLAIVTQSTSEQIEKFSTKIFDVAKATGKSASDIASATESYSRLGYSLEDSLKAAETTSIISNTGAISVDDTTTGLTAVMKAYNMTADSLEEVGDKVTAIDQGFASSVEGLLAGVSRAGSVLALSGTSLDKSLALLTAADASIQNSESSSNSLKTSVMRIRGATAELDELGEEYDEIITSTPKLAAKIEALTKTEKNEGVQILDNAGNYKDMYEIYLELGKAYQNMSSVNQAALLELIAGKNNANAIASIFNNLSDLEGAYEAAQNSAGLLATVNEQYLDSVQAKISQFQSSFQSLSTHLLDSDLMKEAITLGTNLIDFLDAAIQKFGTLSTALGAFTMVKQMGEPKMTGFKFYIIRMNELPINTLGGNTEQVVSIAA